MGTIQFDPTTQSFRRMKPTEPEDIERFQHNQAVLASKSTLGTIAWLSVMYAAAQAAGGFFPPPPDDKDRRAQWDDPDIWVTAYGPRNKAERELLMAQGWKPFSIRVHGRWYHYGQWSIAMPIAMAGVWFDMQRWSNKRKDDDMSIPIYTVATMFQMALNASFLQNTADFLGAIAPGAMTAQEFERAATRIGLSPVGWVVPAMYRQTMSELNDVRRDPRNLIETLRYRTGIMADGIRPAINQLGDPVRANNHVLSTEHASEDQVIDFLRKTGHAPGYIGDRTLKMEDGTTLRTADAMDVKYAMTWAAGRMFKDRVAERLQELQQMDPADQERAIDDIRTESRKAAVSATERAVSEHGAEAFEDWQAAQKWINEEAEK